MEFTTVPKNKRPSIKRRKPSAAVRKFFNLPLEPKLDLVDKYRREMKVDADKCYDPVRFGRRAR